MTSDKIRSQSQSESFNIEVKEETDLDQAESL